MIFDTIIVRFGELTTKGKNRKDFIDKLARAITRSLKRYEEYFTLTVRHDHIYINVSDIENFSYEPLLEIPGLHSFSLAKKENIFDIDEIADKSLEFIKQEDGKTFKIKSRRIDKSFPYISDEINRSVATKVLKNTDLKVDVHNPDILLSIEIRNDGVYFFTKTIEGKGGLPTGSSGRCLMMLSGGIDSPVATYLLMKRGLEVTCIHFAAPPYTNSGVILKLEDLLSELTIYQSKIKLYIVPFTKIQEKIYEITPTGYPITIMRRMMYRIATKLAEKLHILAIANGESIGQVASQTIESMNVINQVTNLPVIRPLCTYDKLDIIKISKNINCYDISIRPYEDCCTIFEVIKPKTKPKLKDCEYIESKFDFDSLIEEAVQNTELKVIE